MENEERFDVILNIKGDVDEIKSSMSSLQKEMSNIQLPKGLGKELETRMRKLSDEVENFEKLAAKAGKSFEGAKQIDASYKKILDYARKVEISFSAIKKEANIDTSKFFPKEIVERIEKAEEAVKNYEKAIEKGDEALQKQKKSLKDIEAALAKNEQKRAELTSKRDAKKTSYDRINSEQGKIKTTKSNELAQEQKNLEILRQKKIALDAEKAAVEALAKKKEALEKSEKAFASKNTQYGAEDKRTKAEKDMLDDNKRAYEDALQAAKKYGDTVRSIEDIKLDQSKTASSIEATKTAIKGLGNEIDAADSKIKKAQNAFDTAEQELRENETAANSLNTQMQTLKTTIEQTENAAKAKGLKELIKSLDDIGVKVDPAVSSFEDVQKVINNLKPDAIKTITDALDKAGVNLDELGIGLDNLNRKNTVFQKGAEEAKRMKDQVDGLKNQVQHFFSLTNSVMLFRRGVQQAIETVKELDKAMTETAVVTDFSVGDMWEELPRYTKAANELGTTTLGAYETMTLFYQQGLETNEVFEIGTETMKMARIAGLEYKDATDLMTAALRGFNMELNETSAQRVNDVYSELAAITAADTQEIANAMTKTASIANSANMEFETTAALLSQIVETTREPAETAGTALKTIIARFTEMKEATSDIINVDGEEISVNKVEAALKSAGVALRDANGEFRDLDDVLLELSSKWNSLDIMTQRYIATTAAGSRQQSRFIAMMQDYERTIELVDAAYNSSGASQDQFEKTQDSLESKLNRLKNAWDEFLMGISNNDIIKKGVDALTALLNVVNKLTGDSGIAKLGVVIGSLKGGSAIFNKIFDSSLIGEGLNKYLDKDKKKGASGFNLDSLTKKMEDFNNEYGGANAGTLVIEKLKQKFKNLGPSIEKTTEKIKKFGVEAKASGKTAFQIFKGVLEAIPGWAKVATVAIAALGTALYLIWKNSPLQKAQRDFETAEITAKHFQESLEEVTKTVEDLKQSWETLSEQESVLNELTQGTIEWNKALNDYNNTILEVIKNHKELAFEVDPSTGKYTIDENKYQEYLKQQEGKQEKAQLDSFMASAFADYQKYRANIVKLQEAEQAILIHEQQSSEDEEQPSIIGNILFLEALENKSEALADLGLSEDYTVEDLQNLKEREIIEYETQTKNALNAFLTKDYGEKISNAAAALVSNVDTILLDRAKIMEDLGIGDDSFSDGISRFNSEAIKDWAEYRGYIYENGKVKTKDGDEVKIQWNDFQSKDDAITNEQIAQELIMYKTANATERRAKNVADVLDNVGGVVSTVFSGDWKNMDENFASNMLANGNYFADYVGGMLAGDLETKKISGLSEEVDKTMIDFLESITNLTFEQIKTTYNNQTVGKIITSKFKEFLENINENMQAEIESLKIDTLNLSGDDKANAELYNSTIDTMTSKEIGFLVDLKEGLNSAFNEVVSFDIFSGVSSALVKLKQEVSGLNTDNFIQAWQQVDWNSPLNSMKNLNQAIEEGSDELSYFATNAKNLLSDNFLSSLNQFKEVLNSEDFLEVNQSLNKIYNTEGKITFDNIKEAAEESGTLNLMLEEGTISATGFAKAMELVAKGVYDVTTLTPELLNALTAAFSLMDNMDQAYSWTTNYDFGKDYSDIGKKYAEASEAVQALAKGGAYGNPQFDEYMNFLIGEAEWEQALKKYDNDTKKAYQSKQKQIKNTKGTLLGAWQSVIKDDDTTKNLAVSMGSNGLLKFDLTNIKSTDDLIKNIVSNTSKTEEEARALVADAINYNSALSDALETLDKIKAINILLNKKNANDNKEFTITDAEMEALDIDEDFINKINEQMLDGYSIKIWSEESKQQTINDIAESMKTGIEEGLNGIDSAITVKVNEVDTEIFTSELEKLKDIDLTTSSFTIPEDILTVLQNTFNSKVDEGIAEGLSVDDAKKAAISGLALLVGDTNAQFLASGLIAGYQDKKAIYAAAKAAAAQGAEMYRIIYTSIVTAMVDAFAKFSGLDVSGTGLRTETDKETNATVINMEGVQYTKEQWENIYGEGTFEEQITKIEQGNALKDILDSVSTDAQNNSQKFFSTAQVLVDTYGLSKEEANALITEMESGDWTPESLKDYVLPNGKTLYDMYKDAGYIGTSGTTGSGSTAKNDTNPALQNVTQKLEALERSYKNGEVGAVEYEASKRELLTSQKDILEKDIKNDYASSKYKDYFYYDAASDSYLLDENKFNSVKNEETKDAIMQDYNRINGKNADLNDVEDALLKLNKPGGENDTTVEEETFNALDRLLETDKVSLKDYNKTYGETLESQQTKLRNEFNTLLSESANKDMYEYDEALGILTINQEEFNNLTEEQQAAILEEYETLQGINSELKDIEASVAETKKYLKYDTTNEAARREQLDYLFQTGQITAEEYQSAVQQNSKQTNRRLEGEKNAALKTMIKDSGYAYFDTNARELKFNPLVFGDAGENPKFVEWLSTMETRLTEILKMPEGEEKDEAMKAWQAEYISGVKKFTGEEADVDFMDWFIQMSKEWQDILKMKNGPEKDAKIKQWKAAYTQGMESGYTGMYYTTSVGSAAYDEVNFNQNKTTKAKDKVVSNVNTVNDANTQQQENKDEFTFKPEEYQHEVDIPQQLAKLERDFQNGKMTYDEYITARDGLYKQQTTANNQDILYALSKSGFAQYINLETDDQGNIVGASIKEDSGFYELSDTLQAQGQEFLDWIVQIAGNTGDINKHFNSPDWVDEEKRKEFRYAELDNFNASQDQDALNRRQQELSGYNSVISQLPSEVQGPLSLITGAAGMFLTADQNLILRRQEENAHTQYENYMGNIKDQGADKYITEDANGNVTVDTDAMKKAGIYSDADIDKIEEWAYQASQYRKEELDAHQQRSGGIFQKPFYIAEKAAKAMSKAFKKTSSISEAVKEAFRGLEKELGLAEGSLSNFETAFTKFIDSLNLEEKTFGGLNKPELLEQIKNSKFGEYMSEDMTNWLGMIFGKNAVDGNTFWETGLNAIGDGFGLGGDFMSFGMIEQGLGMMNTAKGIFDQMKAKIEELIGYISTATQVLVDAWTNREDFLYSFLKQIEKHLQEYENLQRYSTQLEKGRLTSSQDILNNWNNQWASLQQQLEEQTERLETRQEELDRSRLNIFKYISGWDPLSDTLYENRDVKFIWDVVIGAGEAFNIMGTGAFFSQLNQLYEDYDSRVQKSYEDRLAAEQALLDIEDERLELVKIGAEEATEFEQKVLDSILQKEQEAIDELSRLNDAVTEANQKLISTLQDNLEKIRQERENERTEEELGEKERRLAYLRQDTSGANQLEIKKLEEELEEQHEDYTDALIDQKISELEKQNELAAEQRQQQIDLLQGQLDYAEKYGLYWDAIYGMLYTIDENGVAVLNPENFDVDGNIRENSELAQLLGTFSDRMGMSQWSAVLDNEETKRLGRYYGAFIGMNGADGKWANYWALLNPGANDPNYAHKYQDIPEGLWGALYRLEIGIKEQFGTNNPGLVNMGRLSEQKIKNFLGKMFNYDDWANFTATEYQRGKEESTVVAGLYEGVAKPAKEFGQGVAEAVGLDKIFGGKGQQTSTYTKQEEEGKKTTDKVKSLGDNYGTQKYGDWTENYNFNIGTVGENISLDEMTDKVVSALKGLFQGNTNVVQKSR